MLNKLIKQAFQFGLNSASYLQFTNKSTGTVKLDGSESLRLQISKSGEVIKVPTEMSFSRSVVGLTVVTSDRQGAGFANIVAARQAA
jgi:hypothetical protein